MKKTLLIFSKIALLLFLTVNCFAQAPQSFSYQAVVRDAQGNILPNQNVAFRFSIIENNTNGTVVYQETQQATTNTLGLVVLAIGNGTVQQGVFSTIQWGSAPHFLKVELDVAGGANFVDMGTTQLLSVPYALLSQKSISDTLWIQNGNNIYNSNAGRVGIGLTAPNGKVTIQGDTSNVLFEVRDKNGIPVFVVYQDSVHVYVSNTSAKTNKGTFAVNGKTQSKAGAHTIFRVVPDSIVEIKDANGLPIFKAFQDSVQVFVDNSGAKTNKGTFAVNGKTQSKAGERNYLRISPDSSRVYTEDPTAGFGVRDLSSGTATSYMNLTPDNYFIGHDAGTHISLAAQYNVALGFQAGQNLYAGKNNIFLGYKSGLTTHDGYSNIFIGSNAGMMNDFGRMNVYIGDSAGMNPNLGEANIYIGYKSGFNASSQYNTFIGTYTGMNNHGVSNTFLGYNSGKLNNTGYLNTFLGCQAGENNTSGSNNTFIGVGSGSSNTTDNYNTALGYGSDFVSLAQHAFNSTAIGYLCVVNTANTVKLGNASVTTIGGAVGWTTISDKSIKENIKNNVPGLSFINKLKPVTYHLNADKLAELTFEDYYIDSKGNKIKKDVPKEILEARKEKSKITYTGFIAQEVAQAAKETGYDFSGIHYPQNEHDLYSLSYADFVVPLTKAVQELSQKVEEQQKIIEQLQKQLNELKK